MALRPTMADLLDMVHISVVLDGSVASFRSDPAASAAARDALMVTGPLAHAGAVWSVDGDLLDVNYRWRDDHFIRAMSDAEIAAECGIPTAADTPIPK